MSAKLTLEQQIEKQKDKARKERARLNELKRKEVQKNNREILKELANHDVKTLSDFKERYKLSEAPQNTSNTITPDTQKTYDNGQY